MNTERILVWTRAWSAENEIDDHQSEFRCAVTNEGGCHDVTLKGLLKMFRAKRPAAFTLYAASGESSADLYALLDDARRGD
jgi:hypothetical protein